MRFAAMVAACLAVGGGLVRAQPESHASVLRCDVAWMDVATFRLALSAEGLRGVEILVRDCGDESATLEVGFEDGTSRAQEVPLGDVPLGARSRTLALVVADLASLGPPVEEDEVTSEPPGPAEPSEPAGAATEPEDPPVAPDASTAPAEPTEPAAALGDPEAATETPRSPARSPAPWPAPARPSWRVSANAGVRVLPLRDSALLPALDLEVAWRDLLLSAHLGGTRTQLALGRAGTLLTTGRVAWRFWSLDRPGVAVALRVFGEGGLVRVQGRPNGGGVGAIERAPALGGGVGLRVQRPVGRWRIGADLTLGWLRGLVSFAVESDGLRREVGGVSGLMIGVHVSLTRRP